MKFSGEIIKVLDDLGRRFGVAIDWSRDNIQPYLTDLMSRFIKYNITVDSIWLIVGVTISVLVGWFVKHMIDEQADELLITLGALVIAIGIGVSLFEIFEIVKCIYLPEQVVFEFLKGLQQ